MNVNEFAEQIVFGTTLADKLLDPGQLTSFQTNTSFSARASSIHDRLASLPSPGRPDALRMQYRAGNAPPKVANLDSEKARGQLLHFLANHELLATELMALVLLKFPDAPPAFRQGVLVTLREEQLHTQMYLDRMSECGVEFGSFPVSGYFWRVVEPMQSPMDFVSRLSLTFEQANLDYSCHFAKVFREIGDSQTAAVLEQIYQDEIGHVRHGLQWFRQWKDPQQTDWEAYESQLAFPISPERARGPKGEFNREGRAAAGLSAEFIDSVEVFRQSRGRTPTVRWFDPSAEASLVGELTVREERLMDQLGADLECLMLALTRVDDVLLVRRVPSLAFRRQLIDAGFDLPEFMAISDRGELSKRKLNDLSPWAWTPKSYDLASCLLSSTHQQPHRWRDDHVDLFRKSWAANRLRDWLDDDAAPQGFAPPECTGVFVQSVEDVVDALASCADCGYSTALFKQDLATSGRGQRRLPCKDSLSEQDVAWLRSTIRAGVGGVVEPELNRVVDLSLLWRFAAGSDEPTYLGWTRPIVTGGRRYAGTRIGKPISKWHSGLNRFLLADACAMLQRTADWLAAKIVPEFMERQFHGHFGVDAFVYEDTTGELKIKPLVELNPRLTMGHIALELEKRLSPGVPAEFQILSKSQWAQSRSLLANHPLVKATDGRWRSGVVTLSEADDHSKLVPIVLIGEATGLGQDAMVQEGAKP